MARGVRKDNLPVTHLSTGMYAKKNGRPEPIEGRWQEPYKNINKFCKELMEKLKEKIQKAQERISLDLPKKITGV